MKRFMTLYRRQASKPSPRKRNAKRQNDCLRGGLQKAEKRRDAKGKGEKESRDFLAMQRNRRKQ